MECNINIYIYRCVLTYVCAQSYGCMYFILSSLNPRTLIKLIELLPEIIEGHNIMCSTQKDIKVEPIFDNLCRHGDLWW